MAAGALGLWALLLLVATRAVALLQYQLLQMQLRKMRGLVLHQHVYHRESQAASQQG